MYAFSVHSMSALMYVSEECMHDRTAICISIGTLATQYPGPIEAITHYNKHVHTQRWTSIIRGMRLAHIRRKRECSQLQFGRCGATRVHKFADSWLGTIALPPDCKFTQHRQPHL